MDDGVDLHDTCLVINRYRVQRNLAVRCIFNDSGCNLLVG
jgi:hypothetical protein